MAEASRLFNAIEDVLHVRQTEHLDHVAFVREFPPREAVTVPWSALNVRTALTNTLGSRYPSLYRHQAKAIQLVNEGKHVVVTTQTSSGKSLIYAVAIAQALLDSNDSTALLCYPQKALANDQLEAFRSLIPPILSAADKPPAPHLVARYDGQTEDGEKPMIRAGARVILTNPEMLHLAILGWHEKHWQRFLSQLRYVILDEAHDYRGTFGSNVAMLMRRLLMLCGRYGSSPQFIATSATIADPAAHLGRLTGKSFHVIPPEDDGSRQGPKRLWIVQPNSHPFELARGLMKEFVGRDLTVLAFCQSRRSAEGLTHEIGKIDDAVKPIRVYRAGLSKGERVEIEKGLKAGTIGGVFSTSALELGIDIGSFDVCICVGFPNTVMSLWQRSGRVGRAGKPGGVILIPDERPIDAYYTSHPDKLLEREMEPLAINLRSRTLATWHYACAFSEAGRNIELLDPMKLDEPMATIARQHRAGQDQPSYHSENVHREYNMRAGGDASYELIVHDRTIGDISRSQILRETPPNAIYLHGGRKYRVQKVDETRRQVRLHEEHSANRTQSFVQTSVRLQQCWRAGHNPLMKIEEGRLLVTRSLISLSEKSPDGRPVKSFQGNQGLKADILPTTGAVLSIIKPNALLPQPDAARTAFNGLAPLLRGLLPTVLGPCDLGDFAIHPQWAEDEAKLYLYDVAYDGIDLTMHAFGRLGDLLEAARARLRECDCADSGGCFRCVRNPNDDLPTNRSLTCELVELLCTSVSSDPIEVTLEVSVPDRMAPTPSKLTCPKCEGANPLGQKFCGDCGNKLEAA